MNFRVHFRIPPANGHAPKVAQGCRTPKLAVGVARNPSRQRLGVRLSSAALTSVRWQLRHSRSVHCDHEPHPQTIAGLVLPLPKGEGWGEGEGIVYLSTVHDVAHRIFRPRVHRTADFCCQLISRSIMDFRILTSAATVFDQNHMWRLLLQLPQHCICRNFRHSTWLSMNRIFPPAGTLPAIWLAL